MGGQIADQAHEGDVLIRKGILHLTENLLGSCRETEAIEAGNTPLAALQGTADISAGEGDLVQPARLVRVNATGLGQAQGEQLPGSHGHDGREPFGDARGQGDSGVA